MNLFEPPGVLLSAAVVVACAELGSRMWIRRFSRCYVWPPGWKVDVQVDAVTFPELERHVRFEVNADGERGGSVRQGSPGLYRILVAGGSPAENFLLDQPVGWPGALEILLSAPEKMRVLPARAVHVGSVGRSGVASAGLELILRRTLPNYGHVSAIVVIVGGNDVFGWLAHGAPSSVGAPAPSLSDVFDVHPEEPFGWKPRRWGIVRLASRLRRRWLKPPETRQDSGRGIANARAMRARASEVRTAMPDPSGMLDQFERNFREVVKLAKSYADRVVIVRQPWFETAYSSEEEAHIWHGGAGDAWKDSITTYYSLAVLNRLMASVDARAAEVAAEMRVEQIDLRATLKPSLENYYDYVHFTAAGSAVVARAVAEALVSRPVAERGLGREGLEPPTPLPLRRAQAMRA